jgi:hypothetical protein
MFFTAEFFTACISFFTYCVVVLFVALSSKFAKACLIEFANVFMVGLVSHFGSLCTLDVRAAWRQNTPMSLDLAVILAG